MGCLNSKPSNVVSPAPQYNEPPVCYHNEAMVPENPEYLHLSIKDIAERNAVERKTSVLFPLFGKVYDLKLMYNIIYPKISKLEGIKVKNATSKLEKTVTAPSSYMGLLGTCKFVGVKAAILKDIKARCLRGDLKELPLEEQQGDFEKDVTLILTSLNEFNDYERETIDHDYNEHCMSLLKEPKVFQDKAFEPVMKYQDNAQFLLSPWCEYYNMRDYLYAPYYKRKRRLFQQTIDDGQLEELKEDLIATKWGINEGIESFKEWMENIDNRNEEANSANRLLSKLSYRLDYCRVYLTGCEWQIEKLTMLHRVVYKLKDINKEAFPFPKFMKVKELRLFLETSLPFDQQLPADGYAWHHVLPEDVGIYKVDPKEVHKHFAELVAAERCPFETDMPEDGYAWTHLSSEDIDIYKLKDEPEKVHSYFAELVASKREPFDTSIENDIAWNEAEKDAFKNDILTKAQVEVLKLREGRTDMNDKERMKKRRNQLGKYFEKVYDSKYKEPYISWAETLEKSFQEFEEVCEGKREPCIRKPVDKKALAEERYQLIMSQVPLISKEKREEMSNMRENIFNSFVSRYRPKNIPENYKAWADSLEQNEKDLLELCNNNEEVEKQMKERKRENHYPAIFVPYEVFEE